MDVPYYRVYCHHLCHHHAFLGYYYCCYKHDYYYCNFGYFFFTLSLFLFTFFSTRLNLLISPYFVNKSRSALSVIFASLLVLVHRTYNDNSFEEKKFKLIKKNQSINQSINQNQLTFTVPLLDGIE